MSASSPAPTSALATRFLIAGVAGLAVTTIGLFVSPAQNVALSYLTGFAYWTAIAIGMLLLIIIHHLTDAGWSTVIRRQYEHGVSAFKWLAVLFLPLLISAWVKPDLIWPWMNPAHVIHGGETVSADPLWVKKSGFLNRNMFTGMRIAMDLSQRLGLMRADDVARAERVLAAAGLDRAPPRCGAAQALEYMRIDKKVKAGRIRLILLHGIGRAVVTGDYADDALQATLAKYFG